MQLRAAAAIAWPAWAGAVRARLAAWAEAERGRFVLWLPVLMTAGAVTLLRLRAEPPAWLAPALLAAGAGRAGGGLAAACCRAPSRGLRCAPRRSGFAAAQLATWRAPPLLDVPARAVVAEGTVRAVEPLPEGRRVTLEAARLDGGAPLARLAAHPPARATTRRRWPPATRCGCARC